MLLTNVKLATMEENCPYGMIGTGAVALEDGKISWVGEKHAVPSQYKALETVDLDGRLMTPAFVDCHTHIVHGGNRANEFEMRLKGASYKDVAKAGGGIISTVKATREASQAELVTSALPRIDALLAEGVTTIEIKSGYGLDLDTELNMLRAAREIETIRPIRVKTSFLGAHAIPPEYADRPDAYIEEICIPTLSAANAAGLVDAVDGFCESIAFTTEQIARVFEKAQEIELPVKLHAEQLSNMGGTRLAARYGALTVDHLEYANEQDTKAMAMAGSVAVLLPGAFYTLHETQHPPVHHLRMNKVPIAVATDCNPGSSPLTSLLLTMNMASTLFRLTPEECLAGVTRNAAKALGLDDCGIIRAGLRADLSVWNVEHPAELSYRIGFNPLHQKIFGGGA